MITALLWLFARFGFAGKAAHVVADVVLVGGAALLCWWLYDGAYAAPRRQVAALNAQLYGADGAEGLVAGTARLISERQQWQDQARACSVQLESLSRSCARTSAAADAAGRAAPRPRPLPESGGADALNAHLREIYP